MRTTKQDLGWWAHLAPSLTWRFASTMSDTPHSYVVRGKQLGAEEFDRAVRVIRTFGEPGKFYSRTGIYLTIDDTKWWTMGAPLSETIIINQAKASEVYGVQDAPATASPLFTIYDEIATEYDARYQSPEALAENAEVRALLRSYFPRTAPYTLDIGCGTGLLLDLGVTAASVYLGVDPSQGMLNELVRKHPRVTQLLPFTMEQALEQSSAGSPLARKFELVVSLFGSASYLAPSTVRALPQLVQPGGVIVLMHYEPGYLPDYESETLDPETLAPSRDAALELLAARGGRLLKLGRFDVSVVSVP